MAENSISDREHFYQERDSRTSDFLGRESLFKSPVSVHISEDACETQSGQLLLLTLANQLARLHRELRFTVAFPDTQLLTPALCGASTLGDELIKLTSRIDPFGKYELGNEHSSVDHVSIGIGANCRKDLTWYVGFERSNATLAREPLKAGNNSCADLRGAGLASILGAAVAAKEALSLETVPVTLSAWNFKSGNEADTGPSEFLPIDTGSGLIVGAGAVAAAAVYWLFQWGNDSHWTIVDCDNVELHNTNRSLLFFPEDSGWPNSISLSKAECLSKYLGNAVAVNAWYDEAQESTKIFDTVLVLANERDVRTIMSSRNDPIQLQATTGLSWLSQLHRHISGRDDCIRCRMNDIRSQRFACSEAPIATADQPERDAALPFLSTASGLMLVSALQQLKLGGIDNCENMWNWDFRNSHRMASAYRCFCRNDCSTALTPKAQNKIASMTCWSDAPWIKRYDGR